MLFYPAKVLFLIRDMGYKGNGFAHKTTRF